MCVVGLVQALHLLRAFPLKTRLTDGSKCPTDFCQSTETS